MLDVTSYYSLSAIKCNSFLVPEHKILIDWNSLFEKNILLF